MTPDERSRLLRECAVELIRASDLSTDLSIFRVRQAIKDLDQVEGSYRAELRTTKPGRTLLEQFAA